MIEFTVQSDIARSPGGKQLSFVVEVTEFERDNVLALSVIEGALPVDARITLEPVEHGTRLRFHARGQPAGMLRLIQPLLRRTLRGQLNQDCETLKRVLEDSGSFAPDQ